MEKDRLKPIEYVIITLTIIAGFLTIWRCFYTVDLTDESYIYADALATIKGNIPYAHNFTEGAGMSFVTMVFLWIYMKLVPSLAGVVLYMRLCFAVLRLVEVYGIYRLLRRKHKKIPVLLGCSILTVWHYFSNYFSYNTISIWLFLLVSVVLYVSYDAERNKRLYVNLGVLGVLSALAVFANPFYIISVAEIVILLLVLSPKNTKIKSALAYCAGGILQGFVVLVGICAQVGVKAFLQGIKCMLFVGSSQSSFNRANRIRKYWDKYWLLFLMMLLAFAVGYLVKKLRGEKDTFLAVELALLAGIAFSITHSDWCLDIWKIGGHIGTVATFIAIILYFVRKSNLFWFTAVPFITITFLELLCSKGGFAGIHSSFAVPTLVGTIIVIYEGKGKTEKIICCITTSIIFFSILIADVFYVYRDEPLMELDTKISRGIYEGIVSSKQNAECLPEMETYLRSTISSDENIMLRDCVPFAYLMLEAKICDLKTWDPLDYSYGENTNPVIMYRYFENKGCVPDEVIYIDFGRDLNVSAEDDEWRFNEWLFEHYMRTEEQQLNNKFRIVRFVKTENIDD